MSDERYDEEEQALRAMIGHTMTTVLDGVRRSHGNTAAEEFKRSQEYSSLHVKLAAMTGVYMANAALDENDHTRACRLVRATGIVVGGFTDATKRSMPLPDRLLARSLLIRLSRKD